MRFHLGFLGIALAGLTFACAGEGAVPHARATPTSAGAVVPARHGAEARTRSFRVRVVGEGPPMVLIPGLGCSGAVWNGAIDHFKKRYTLHVVTIAGFGGEGGPSASAPAPFLERVRRDLLAYFEQNRLDHPVVVGHSLGGFMAYWLAATAPDRVGPIVAVDGLPFLSDAFQPGATVATSRAMAERMREHVASLGADAFARENRQALSTMITDPRDVDAIAKDSARSSPSAVAQAMYELMTTDLRDVVGSVKSPALLVAAGAFAKDAASKRELVAQYEAQVARIRRHRVVVAEKARHFVMLDAPAFLFEQVDAFLATAGARS